MPIDDKRLNALAIDHVREPISRVEEAVKRLNLRNPARIINVDESGTALKSFCRQTLGESVGKAKRQLYPTEISTTGSFDRVTIMDVVSAVGRAYRPAINFPGKKARYRFVNGNALTLQTYLPECNIYKREIAGTDSAIFFDWAELFLFVMD